MDDDERGKLVLSGIILFLNGAVQTRMSEHKMYLQFSNFSNQKAETMMHGIRWKYT